MLPSDERAYQAVEALRRGWRIIPLQGKRPILAKWQEAAFPSEIEGRAWAEAGNYGVVTGEPGGVVVLDVDDGKLIETMMAKHVTVTALTGKGCHLYFHTPDVPVKNAVGMTEGVDFRGVGGQVVGVGSIHPEHGGIYRWAPGRAPGQIDLAELPAEYLDHLRKDKAKPAPAPVVELDDDVDLETLDVYDRTALDNEIRALRNAGEGGRNHALNKAAFSLGQLVAAGRLPRKLVFERLWAACQHNGLFADDGEWQCAKSIESGMNAGAEQPREPRETLAPKKSEPEAKLPVESIEVTDLADPELRATPPEWFVRDLVLKKGLHLVWAQPGGYKTRLTARIMLELLTHDKRRDPSHTLLGNPDWPIMDQLGRVLMLTTEEDKGELRFVINTVERGWGAVLPHERWQHVYAHQLRLDRALTIDDLPTLLDMVGPVDMVVLDSLTGLRPKDGGTQWDVDNEAANIMCLKLRRMIADRGLSLWVIHHSDKLVKNYRGPTEWWASADVMFGLLAHYDKDNDKNLIKLLPQKARGGRVHKPAYIEPVWTNQDGDLVLEFLHEQKGSVLDAKLKEILDMIDIHSNGEEGVGSKQLREALGMADTTLRRYLNTLAQAGEIRTYPHPEMRGNPTFIQRLS